LNQVHPLLVPPPHERDSALLLASVLRIIIIASQKNEIPNSPVASIQGREHPVRVDDKVQLYSRFTLQGAYDNYSSSPLIKGKPTA
jgi:hypothetical protein